MTSKFEQLIEYVINDEEAKAKELFHDIVVEKSREIYENLMQEEAEEIEEDAEELDEAADEELDEGLENMDEMGGDASEQFMDEVEVEEEGMMEEEEEVEIGGEIGGDEEGSEDLEDRVVDLEDKLDELMAEFEAMMDGEDKAQGDGDDFGPEEGGDAIEMDDTEEFELAEGIDLKAAPKPVTSEEGSVNKKTVNANNSGAAGMAAKPVSASTGEEKGRAAPTAKDLGVAPTQDAGSKAFKSAAPAPVKTQAAGVNTRTPFPKG